MSTCASDLLRPKGMLFFCYAHRTVKFLHISVPSTVVFCPASSFSSCIHFSKANATCFDFKLEAGQTLCENLSDRAKCLQNAAFRTPHDLLQGHVRGSAVTCWQGFPSSPRGAPTREQEGTEGKGKGKGRDRDRERGSEPVQAYQRLNKP